MLYYTIYQKIKMLDYIIYQCGITSAFKFQEGRMRGQAFVTFPSVELAHQALVCISWDHLFTIMPELLRDCWTPVWVHSFFFINALQVLAAECFYKVRGINLISLSQLGVSCRCLCDKMVRTRDPKYCLRTCMIIDDGG
jgi:hypothetical protein